MNKPEHSPLPWIAGGWDGSIDCVYDANGDEICEPSPQNADHIVTACNAYYKNKVAIVELVEALEPFAKAADARKRRDITGGVCFSQTHLIKARRAIAKHKAKP